MGKNKFHLIHTHTSLLYATTRVFLALHRDSDPCCHEAFKSAADRLGDILLVSRTTELSAMIDHHTTATSIDGYSERV